MANPLFKTKQVKIDTLGEYLSSVRKQLELDIRTVSETTHIKPLYLEQLEAGDYAKLPADVYVRGFLKSLASAYRIKEQLLIDQYEKERGIGSTKALATLKRPSVLYSFTPRTIIIGLSILGGLLAVWYVGNEIRSVLAPPYLALAEPAKDGVIQGNSLVVSGQGEPGAEIFINNQPVLVDSKGQFTENLILSEGVNVIQVLERNKFGKTTTITRTMTAQIPSEEPVVASAVNITVQVGPNSAWIYLEADGVVVQRGTMLAGSVKTISAHDSIILTSANAGSTTVVLNGKDLGKLGREGEVVRNVEFSPQ